jgi:hypothetical protein
MTKIYKMIPWESHSTVAMLDGQTPYNPHEILQNIRTAEEDFNRDGTRNPAYNIRVEYSYLLPDDATARLDGIVERFDTTAYRFMNTIESNLHQNHYSWPWAIVAFPNEYKLGAFFRALRGDATSPIFASYSGDSARAGCILFYSLDSLKNMSYSYQPLAAVHDLLEESSTTDHWFCFTDPAESNWLLGKEQKEEATWLSLQSFGVIPPPSVVDVLSREDDNAFKEWFKKQLMRLSRWVE